MNNNSQLDSILKRMAEDHRPELPSPGLIWWRAQILRKQHEQARIERPVMIMRLVAVAACLVVFAALVAANWPQFQALMGSGILLLSLAIVILTALLVSASLLWPAAKGR
ncbi:MAG TPA: hypothetical protein VI488_19155 [Candidatus Angelobacter sp.]